VPISSRNSLSVGFDALRANPLRSLLSTLGVVMGVAAMVSVLAMGDGVERFARQQIARTTDLLGIAVTPKLSTTLDGVTVRRDDIVRFRSRDARALGDALTGEASILLETVGAGPLSADGLAQPRGLALVGTLAPQSAADGFTLVAGRWFRDADTAVVVLDTRAAGIVAADSARPDLAVGRTVRLTGAEHAVVGVVALDTTGGIVPSAGARAMLSGSLTGFVPVDDAERAIAGTRAPRFVVIAARIEDVDSLRAATERWLATDYGPAWKQRVSVETNQARVEQVTSGMLVFKLLMGAITGVSLLVGGIGIMNVLLAAVAERTREIGIRKATGARDRDILAQFLCESVAISGAGAAVGVALGLGIAFLAAAIMRAQSSAPVHAAVTLSTILVAVGASIAIGLAFGLYPALRASRLSPIDAIRHE